MLLGTEAANVRSSARTKYNVDGFARHDMFWGLNVNERYVDLLVGGLNKISIQNSSKTFKAPNCKSYTERKSALGTYSEHVTE